MSYSQEINSLQPVYYWELSNSILDSTGSVSLNISSASYAYPGIITNSGSITGALRITQPTTASWQNPLVTSTGKNKFVINKISKEFSIAFWFNFNNQLTGSGDSTTPYTNNQLTILSINSSSGTNLAKIYYDYLSNTMRFYVAPDSSGEYVEAIKVLNSLDQSLFIVASRKKDGSLSIGVNNTTGQSGYAYSTSPLFSTADKDLYFSISGSSLTGASSKPKNFLLSSLALFQSTLTESQIQKLMIAAANDGKPIFQGMVESPSFFDFSRYKPEALGEFNYISGDSFNKGQVYNLIVDSKKGLIPNDTVDYLTESYGLMDPPNQTVTYSNNGVTWSGKYGLDFSKLTTIFNFLDGATVTASITRGSASNDCLFSIYPINNDNAKTLYLKYQYNSSSWHYYLGIYDSSTKTETTIIDQNVGTTSASSSRVGVSFDQDYISLYSSEGGTKTISTVTLPYSRQIKLTSDSQLTIGNMYASPTLALYSSIKNFGMYDSYTSDFSTADFSNPTKIMFRLTNSSNPYFASQSGSWVYTIPSTNILNCYCIGTHFDWQTMDNCAVYVSADGGITYNKIKRNNTATNYNLSAITKNIMVKVVINTEYDLSLMPRQSFNNFYYNLYENLTFTSDSEYYSISPTSKTLTNYVPSQNNNILSRQNNFGIKFTGDSNKPVGNALVSVPSTSSYNAIEFWYRPDDIVSGVSNYILNNVSSSTSNPYIYINSLSKFRHSGGTLYINGASAADNTITASAQELYHLVLVLSSSNNSNLYLNGGGLSNTASNSFSTYGYLRFFNYIPTAQQIVNRYQNFFTPLNYFVTDDNSKKLFSVSSSTTVLTKKIKIKR